MEKIKRWFKIFWIFFKVGSFTFGGGLAMLPLIQKEVVDNQHWVEEEEILDVFAISQSVPGVIAINSSIFVGSKVMGLSGAIAAALGVILPAFIAILLVLLVLTGLKNNPYVDKVFAGIRAASAALILLSAIKLGKAAVRTKIDYAVAAAAFVIIVLFNISAAWAVVLGGVVGYGTYLYSGRKK
ncbi:MAG: chromate transporter [Bacillota bacterium]|nr:chromate transporter [Bacillota bacterium]